MRGAVMPSARSVAVVPHARKDLTMPPGDLPLNVSHAPIPRPSARPGPMADSASEPTISTIRRKLISATAPAEPVDSRSESVDFDHYTNNYEQAVISSGLQQLLKPGTNGH